MYVGGFFSSNLRFYFPHHVFATLVQLSKIHNLTFICIQILRDQYQLFIICYLLQAENQIMSTSNTDNFTFEELQLWNSARLKDYLRDRGLPVTGSIEKLRATVYGAQVNTNKILRRCTNCICLPCPAIGAQLSILGVTHIEWIALPFIKMDCYCIHPTIL